MENQPLTESQQQFNWKIKQHSTVRNPEAEVIRFIKPFAETRFSNYPKLQPTKSNVSRNDYSWKSQSFEKPPPINHLATETEANTSTTTKLKIDRNRSNFGILLHPAATTNNLTYRDYSQENKQLNSRDAITFWNWKNTIERNKFTELGLSRPRDYRNPIKHVPNNAMTTEVRSNFMNQLKLVNKDDTPPNERSRFIDFVEIPSKVTSENTIYGSGIRIQKYLS